MKYSGCLNKRVSQWFNEHFTFDASDIPDTEEAYPEYEKRCNEFINSVTYETAIKCLEDLNAEVYDYDKLGIEFTDTIYEELKKCADKMTW